MADKRKKTKEKKKHMEQIELLQGIYLEQQKLSGKQILLNGCLRSVIVFSVVFGSIGGFLSAFQISYNYLLVAFFFLLISIYASLLYVAPRLFYRDFGYILFFCLFIPVVYLLRVYANSGLYEIVNTILQRAEIFFNLPGIVEYEVQIDDPYITVSVFAVFVGMAEILILNIWVYITMSIGWTVFITFPILLLPIYMKQSPEVFYIVLMGFGYLAVLIFKANGHYMSRLGEAKLRAGGRKRNMLAYTQDTAMLKQVLVILFVMCLLAAGIAGRSVPRQKFERYFKRDTLWDNGSEIVGNVMMLGLGGIFNWYESAGGINGGRLGGVAGVRPDGQPDLIVSFTPYSNEPVYLKAYTGGVYGDNRWEDILPVFERDSLKAETEWMEQEYTAGVPRSAKGKMRVKNVGANVHYLYFPYYTEHEDNSGKAVRHIVLEQGIGMEQEKAYIYYPLQKRDELGKTRVSDMDVSKVDITFLNVPEKNREVLKKQCEEIGLSSSMTEDEMIEAVRTYFSENIPYSLHPGATPRDEDFVNYFLTKNRKGYCAHFATAATLLFRQMGMPARYVEGYVFSMETAFISDINETEQYTDYYDGYSALGESAVLDVEVTDAMAHAWVEVYMDGFGWCVAEVTPGRAEVTDEDDFWSIFKSVMDSAADRESRNGNAGQILGDLDLLRFSWFFYVIVGGMVLFSLRNVPGVSLRKLERRKMLNQPDAREALIARYANVCDMERLISENFNTCRSHAEQIDYFFGKYGIMGIGELEGERLTEAERDRGSGAGNGDRATLALRISTLLERISFSRLEIAEEEREQVLEMIGLIQSAIKRTAGVRQKIRLFLR